MDASGRRLAKALLPEGVTGMTRPDALVGEHAGDNPDDVEVLVGIETDRGPWVAALVAAGYTVFAINPLQTSHYRARHTVSGAKSDVGDAHVLADMVRTDAHQLRPVAGDTATVEAVKVVTRTHKTLIWECTRHTQRLRHALRDHFPAALVAFEDLDAADTLELLAKAPTPAEAARLTQISAALRRARRRDIPAKAAAIQAALRAEHLGQPDVVTGDYAVSVRALVAVLTVLDDQAKSLQGQVEEHFGRRPAAEVVGSQPGLGPVLGARVLAEFGDDPDRYATAKARKNYTGTSPIIRASGRKKTVATRHVHNDRLIDALMTQAFTSLRWSPGARAYYDRQRERGASHNAALRQLANRLVGILHGCLKTGALYDEATAWPPRVEKIAAPHFSSWDVFRDGRGIGSGGRFRTRGSGRRGPRRRDSRG
ncbi:transposase [Parafrankia colletiae]|uniref:Transposase n=1 Tax=Parafrankia colletiae TaxID=573497 RepID=A0A1S1PWT1_9ACTN|nr:IS110 family transposase [Frankia sp. Cpl3]OHV27133.1 transposase [Parafrankia colletiae]